MPNITGADLPRKSLADFWSLKKFSCITTKKKEKKSTLPLSVYLATTLKKTKPECERIQKDADTREWMVRTRKWVHVINSGGNRPGKEKKKKMQIQELAFSFLRASGSGKNMQMVVLMSALLI